MSTYGYIMTIRTNPAASSRTVYHYRTGTIAGLVHITREI
jgi:hypothetical protein